MPTYTYQCAECGVAFDQFQKFSEDPLTECRSCDGTVKRVIHPVGIVFKGAGWYITDSRPKSSGDGGDGAKETKSKAADKPDAPVKTEKEEKSSAPAKTEKSPAKVAD